MGGGLSRVFSAHPDSLYEELVRYLLSLPGNAPFSPPSPIHIMANIPDPTFNFCGCFSGKGNISAARWLKKLEYELTPHRVDGTVPPSKLLECINLLLTDEAAEWAETNPDAARLLGDEKRTAETAFAFRNLFQERFPARSIDLPTVSFDIELSELKQRPDEPISSYYKRFTALMLRVGARDRPAAGLAVLSLLESATLDVIMKAFIKGLFDDEVRKDTIRGLTTTGRSLRGLCTLAEDADRAKKELHKLLDGEHKTRELEFYRDVVRQNMAQEKIESLLATYRAQPVPKEWAFDNPFEKPSLTHKLPK